MNWGYKITLLIVVFMVAMLSMVGIAFQQKNEMIDTNYYDKEIKYQTLIDGANNLNKISTEDLISMTESQVILSLPEKLHSKYQQGQIEFIKNDDMKKDRTIQVVPDSSGIIILDKKSFARGEYSARIQWVDNHIYYYREQVIFIRG